MKFRHLLLLPCLACAVAANAEVYKRVDKDGNVTYSNKPIKGGRKIELEPLPLINARDDHDAHYERVKRTTQQNRDAARRRVLEDELANEEQLLVAARQNLKQATDAPRTPRADGVPPGDAPEQDGDLKHAQDEVTLHERNVDALKQELSGIR